MKNFFSIKKFKEIKVLFFLEIIIGLLLYMLISANNFEIKYWNFGAFSLSVGTWLLSSIFDKEKYWNAATLLGTVSFLYLLWWLIFNIQLN